MAKRAERALSSPHDPTAGPLCSRERAMTTGETAGSERAYIDLYVSYGVADRGVTVRGRALAGRRPRLGEPGDGRRRRLRATWSLFETDELAGVELDVSLATDDA